MGRTKSEQIAPESKKILTWKIRGKQAMRRAKRKQEDGVREILG